MPLALVATVATIGLPEATTYFMAQNRGSSTSLLKRGVLLLLLPAGVATALLILMSAWISAGNPTVHRLIVVSAGLVAPTLLLSLVRAAAAAHNRWGAITIERIITAGSKLIPLIILFAMGRLNLTTAATVVIASTVIGALAYIPLIAIPGTGSPSTTITNAEFLRYSGGIWVGAVSGIFLLRIDQVLLSPLSGAFQLGIYAVAASVSEIPVLVNSAIRETAFTHISDQSMGLGNTGELSRVSTIIVIALCVPLGALSPIFIPLLFGQDFSGAVPVLIILLLATGLSNPGSIAGVGLAASGLPHLRSLALVGACIVNIPMLILLVPSLGATGAAIAALLGYLTASNICIAVAVFRHNAKFGDYYRFRSTDFRKVLQLLVRAGRRLQGFSKPAND
jgi:O-antigen/teichoic acid export membrane protein